MAFCCHPSRRQFLRWAGLVAASPLLGAAADVERAFALGGGSVGAAAGPMVAVHLELVTVTETTAVVTWFTGDPTRLDALGRPAPVAADTEVLLGTSSGSLKTVVHDATPTAFHYAEITGLEPGRSYVWLARSDGVAAVPAVSAYGSAIGTSTAGAVAGAGLSGPFTFTTPLPPPGRYLFSIALCNDLHLGETVAGLATTQQGVQIPPGIVQAPGLPPYAEVMGSALAVEARQRGADVLLAAGDLTSEASLVDVRDAKRYLDAFGTHGRDYFVARGNHDRPHTGPSVAACRSVPGAPDQHDCFGDAFFGTGPTWFAQELYGLRVLGLDTYDKLGNGGDNGVLSDAQFRFVREQLARDKDRPTLVFGHHPVSAESDVTTVGVPLGFDLDPQQAVALEQAYAAAPGVFLHHAAHTHRNKRTVGTHAPGVVFQEVAAVKEYPGGFHLLRLYTGGYSMNFYKFRSALAQEWSERSRPEYGGLAPFYTFGNFADRNSVVARDLSGLRAPVRGGPAGGGGAGAPGSPNAPGSSRRGEALPATGGDESRRDLLGAATLAAGVATEAWLRRSSANKGPGVL